MKTGSNLEPTASAPRIEQSGFHIPSLDGIRAVAFLIVFVAHAGLDKWIPGYFGLTLFFFLSGYLITTLLRMEYDKTGDVSLSSFYLRRVLRISPPFYLILAAALILTLAGALPNTLTPQAIAAQMCQFTNYYIVSHGWWTGMAPGTWVYWSLAVEEHFYLLFPLFYLFLRRRGCSQKQQLYTLLALCAAVLVWRCVLIFGLHAPKDRVYVATDTRVDSILFGCILAVYGNPVLDAPRLSEKRLRFFWLPLGLALLLVSIVIKNFEFQQTFRYTLQGIGLFPVFITVIRCADWGVVRWLNDRRVVFLGVISYSLYLMHTTVLYGLETWTNWRPLLRGGVALLVCIGLATVIYYAVEKPAARLRRNLSKKWASPKKDALRAAGNA